MSSAFDYAGDSSETVQLVMPEPLRIRRLNGRVVELPMMLEYPYTVTLAAGPQAFDFQYGAGWGQGQGNELVRGPIMEVVFEASSGESYEVDYARPESVRDIAKADQYLAGFNAWLLDSQGRRKEAVVSEYQGGLVKKLTSSFGANSAESMSAAEAEQADGSGTRLQSLQRLWQSASEEEKKEFMQWVVAPGS